MFGLLILAVLVGSVALVGRSRVPDPVALPTQSEPVAGVVQEFSPTVTVDGTALAPFTDAMKPEGNDPAVGQPAPIITGQNFLGDPVSTASDGQATVIVFLAHWCPHCQAEFPRLVDAWIRPDLPDEVRVVAVPTAQDPDGNNWPPSVWMLGGTQPWDEPVLLDTEELNVGRAMGVTSYPFFVVIGPDGNVLVRTAGEQGLDGLTAMIEFATQPN